MNVLADLLEVTATCIGDLVKETREDLEDHDPGVAPVRFGTAQALSASWTAICARRGPRSPNGYPTPS
jgi:hypothetical protein